MPLPLNLPLMPGSEPVRQESEAVEEAPQSRLRGWYDFSQSNNLHSGLHGVERWLDPLTMHVYDTSTSERRQWTFPTATETPGVYRDHNNVRFVPY